MPFDTAIRRARRAPLRIAFGAMLVALLAALLIAPSAPAQAVPQSLEGEMFVADQIDVNSNCPETIPATYAIDYTASGPATGPYPGTFTETGHIEGVTGFNFGPLAEWNVSFTIDSPPGGVTEVTGTKTLTAGSGYCIAQHNPIFQLNIVKRTTFAEEGGQLAYRAAIETAAGKFVDQGEASASVRRELTETCTPLSPPTTCTTDLDRKAFTETFIASTGVLPTTGKATGGGQVISGSNPQDRVTFGFNVRKSEEGSRLQGNCNVLDHATSTHIKCLTVTDYVQTGNTATWEGTASVNGVQETYRITVQDNGEPNQGLDTFSIVAGTYQASGNVQNGNIKIHKQ